jgi:hypothetical protein
MYDWMCPAGHAYFLNTDKVGWLPVRPFSAGKIAEQGDYCHTFIDAVKKYTERGGE